MILVLCTLWNWKNKFYSHLQIAPITNNVKSLVINLDRNKNRLQQFNRFYYKSDLRDIPLERFDAIDGKLINIKDYVTPKAQKQILFAETNGYRLKHYELTRGAVGCALSHVSLYYKLMIDTRYDFYIIFEDDAFFSPDMIEEIKLLLDLIPSDWDILTLGTIHQVVEKTTGIFTKLTTFWGLFGYIINKRGARKYIKDYESHKIDKQIDSQMSIMILKYQLNIYGLIKPLVKQDNGFGTDIQVAVKKNDNINPFILENFSNTTIKNDKYEMFVNLDEWRKNEISHDLKKEFI